MTDNHDHETIPAPSAPAVSPLAACEAEINAVLTRYRCSIVPVLGFKSVGTTIVPRMPGEIQIAADWRIVPQE